MLASSGERDPSLRSAGDRPELGPVNRHQAGLQECLDQAKHAFVSNAATHAVHQGHVVDRVEGRHDTLPTSMASRRWCGWCGDVMRGRAARLS